MTGLKLAVRKSLNGSVSPKTAARRRRFDFAIMYSSVLGVTLLVAGFGWKRAWQPYIGLSLGVLFLIWLAWTVRPRLGLNLTLFFALVADGSTIPRYPFVKNLSSRETISWVSDGISISPLELTLLVGLAVVGFRRWVQQRGAFTRGELVIPLAILIGAIGLGMFTGLSSGGDLRVAIIEVRPLLLFPIMYLLTISVCDEARHYRHLLYTALAGIVVQAVLSAEYAIGLGSVQRERLESLTDHGSSIGMNLLFLTMIVSLVIKGCPWRLRLALMVASVPAAWVYVLSQRRVAFVALALGLILFAVILFWRQRSRFWIVVPIIAILGLGYVGAFWNSGSPIGFPAQAVKTVVAPGELSAADQSSDDYRLVENFNLRVTIRSSPILGLGFGQPFLRPIPLPDISSFIFHEYIPHNSVLYLWIKTGVVGFIAFYYALAKAMVSGVERVRRQAIGVDLVVSIVGLLFIAMFALYLIGDIAWEPRNSLLYGFSLALCTSGVGLGRDESDPSREPAKTEPVNGEIPPEQPRTLTMTAAG